MPDPSTVSISYDGTDITDHVVVSGTRFESLINAQPGTAEILVKDQGQTMDFVTGRELICEIDGEPMWGGYVTHVRRRFGFPAVDTVNRSAGEVEERMWVIQAVDFNILLDKRVLRNTADYLHQLPRFHSETFDGELIQQALADYCDIPSGFDITSEIDNTDAYRSYYTLTNGSISSGATTVTVDDIDEWPGTVPFFALIKNNPVTGGNREIVEVTDRSGLVFTIGRGKKGTTAVSHADNSFFMHYQAEDWPQQGSPLRQVFEDFANFSGAVYYVTADKTFHYHALESTEARWGFSDLPNKDAVTASPVEFQGSTYGFRDINAVEDGSVIVNDAFVWGGSEWSGTGQTVFARRQNAGSIADHGLWQIAETHFAEEGYKLQRGVNARAKVIVDGGATVTPGFNPGLRFPQWDISLTWFAKDVPRISGTPDHLRAGQLVTIELDTFGTSQILPMRSLRIDFPGLHDSGEAWVRFQGSFSLQLSDPYTLWQFLRRLSRRRGKPLIAMVDGTNPAPYGALFSGSPEPDQGNGSVTVFDLPDERGYVAGTTQVYVEPGELQRVGIDYDESDPDNGEITFTSAPANGDWVWIVCRTT